MNAVFACALLVVGGFGRAKSGDSNSGSSGNGQDNTCLYEVDGMGVSYDVAQLKMEGFDYKIYGGEHVWFNYEDINSSELIWEFFSNHDINGYID